MSTNLNASPSPKHDRDHLITCRTFSNPTLDHQDDIYSYRAGSSFKIKNEVKSGLKLTLSWKIKSPPDDHLDQNLQQSSSSSESTDLSSYNNNNNNNNNNNTPIRVCTDCNTTKTPLWRSGPKGPKSLCNACGIRRRKERCAAAAAATGTVVSVDQPPAMKIKVKQHKEKIGKNSTNASRIKKRCNMIGGSQSNYGHKNRVFEDFLMNLSENLTFHCMFPEDEKDAAMLLMALSSGLVHG